MAKAKYCSLATGTGAWKGIYFGLEREGEHGLFCSGVKMKDLTVTDDGGISFVVQGRDLFSERPATLQQLKRKRSVRGLPDTK